MRKKIVDQLIALKNTYGETILFDNRRLIAFIKDYFPFARREHQLLAKGMAINLYSTIKGCDIHNCMLIRNQSISLLHKEHLMDIRAAEDAVDLWISFIKKEQGIDTAFSEDKLLVEKLDEASKHQLKAYQKTAELGDLEAIMHIAHTYYNGENTAQNHEEAVKWYKKAAALNHVDAMNYLGNMYYMGQGEARSYTEALKWYKKAAALESATAMNYIGNMYYEGKGVAIDLNEAMNWYQRAARLGNYTAMFNIGYMYYEGHRSEHEQTEAWYKEQAQNGSIEAMNHLAYMYHTGDGTGQDYDKALALYSEIANLGHTSAMIWIAYMYLNGQGVQKDYEEAMKWCKKAASTLE
ncbi:tetratricopeptide repeat protein [Cellulosilyticum sp. I15G10I2]|uniref:tetratricopeptide repeat protein n=1 Tax=Cellulosilyticum sp. I15G10I2 TaxID=1892843 RepID=UPI00085BD177|nr:tetratricopeptide repeat protein [Cellulosilyticum sp. I15G10I2]